MSELLPAALNRKRSMSQRNITKELSYYIYNDREYGEDIEHICYPSLIRIITELCDRIEKLEENLTEMRKQNDT
jgi:hypothetical protein